MENKVHHSFGFALAGILHAFRDNRNIRIHTVIAILVLVASFLLGLTKIEKIIILLVVVLVIASEMINTAIEEMVDLITGEHREEAKRAKDVAAGMVLVAAIGAIIVGIVIFTPYIF
jgi:diacylglycerol kinase